MPDEELKILDDDLNELPHGEVGLIFQKNPTGSIASYLGKDAKQITVTEDGFSTVGDLGWVDSDGWVYLADRRVDMIVTGGANVFPAEVEAALSEDPGVADVVVIGIPDEEWGHRVHAIVQPARGRPRRGLSHRCRQGAPRPLQGSEDGRVHRDDAAGRVDEDRPRCARR